MPISLAMKQARDFMKKLGYYVYYTERGDVEGGAVLDTALALRRAIKHRGFTKMAGHTILLFDYDEDTREVIEIPEVTAWLRELDALLPELPCLLAHLDLGVQRGKPRAYPGPTIYVCAMAGGPGGRLDLPDRPVFKVDIPAVEKVRAGLALRFDRMYWQHNRPEAEAHHALENFWNTVNIIGEDNR